MHGHRNVKIVGYIHILHSCVFYMILRTNRINQVKRNVFAVR